MRELALEADLPLLERWVRSPHVVRWWGPPDAHLAAVVQGLWETHAVISVDGRPVGYVCWQRPSPSELQAAGLSDLSGTLMDIDILIGEPEFLGRRVAPAALGVLLRRLRREGVAIAGLGTSTLNRAALRAFAKAGFQVFRDFEDWQVGRCRYLVARLDGDRVRRDAR